jgi:hypothetical protein
MAGNRGRTVAQQVMGPWARGPGHFRSHQAEGAKGRLPRRQWANTPGDTKQGATFMRLHRGLGLRSFAKCPGKPAGFEDRHLLTPSCGGQTCAFIFLKPFILA